MFEADYHLNYSALDRDTLEPRLEGCSVTLLGPYPPPVGGVQTHIRRLHRRLLRAGIDSQVYCTSGRDETHGEKVIPRPIYPRPMCYISLLLYPGIQVNSDIVHCHDFWMTVAPALVRLRAIKKKLVITVHNQLDSERWAETSFLRRLACHLLARCSGVQWIAVSDIVRSQLVSRGVEESRISVVPAFLPIDPRYEAIPALPPSVEAFCAAHQPIFTIYGYRYWLQDGLDVYGFDMAVEAARELRSRYPNLGLVVCVPEPRLMDYHTELLVRVSKYGLAENVFFITEPIEEAYPLWAASSIYLRPTTTDGDAVAVREALSLGVPVVASDASPRPTGTITFPVRDQRRFVEVICETLDRPWQADRNMFNAEWAHGYSKILGVYERALNKR